MSSDPAIFSALTSTVAMAQPDEHRVLANERAFQQLADYVPQLMWIANPDGWVYWYNRQCYTYTGATQQQMEGWGWQSVSAPEELPRVLAGWRAAIKTGEPFEITFSLKGTDGVFRPFLARAAPLKNEVGEVIRWFGTNTDITEQMAVETALRESEAKFRAVTETMPQVVWSSLPDGYHDYYNQRWYEFTGARPQDTEGRGWSPLFHPNDQGRALETWHRSLETGEPYEIEYRLRAADGSYRWMLGRALPIRNNHGDITRWFGTCTDIQLQKDTEAALKESFKRETSIREVIEAVYRPTNLDDKYQQMSNELGQLLGADHVFISRYDAKAQTLRPPTREYRSSDCVPTLLIKNLEALVSDTDWVEQMRTEEQPFTFDSDTPNLSEAVQHYLEKQQVKSGLASTITYQGECLAILFIHQTRHPRLWTETERQIVSSIAKQAAVATYQVSLYRQEQKARLEAEHLQAKYRQLYDWERQTREFIQKLGQIQDHRQLMVTLAERVGKLLNVDRCSIIEFKNRKPQPLTIEYLKDSTMESFIGVTSPWEQCSFLEGDTGLQHMFIDDTQLIGHTLADEWRAFFSEKDIRGFAAIPVSYQGEILNALVLHTKAPRHWNEHEITFLDIIADQAANVIFKERTREAAETANRKKSEFLAMMSHELRTPLNAILGFSKMIATGMAGPINEKQTKYLNNVDESGQHLLTLINDLLDVSKIEAGKMDLVREWVEAESLVSEVRSMMISLAEREHIRLAFEVSPEVDSLYVDPGRFKQILVNLIHNAIKFNKHGGSVTVRLCERDGQVVGTVEDTGIGIPPENLPDLFHKFYQVDTSAARKQEGTGLGLALTRDLIELHGGTIEVASLVGRGTTFTLRIPANP